MADRLVNLVVNFNQVQKRPDLKVVFVLLVCCANSNISMETIFSVCPNDIIAACAINTPLRSDVYVAFENVRPEPT